MTVVSRLACLVLGALLVFPGTARAQGLQNLLGQTVVSVVFEVEGRADTSPTLAALSDVRVGQPLRQVDVRATLQHLESLNRYESLEAVGTVAPGGVAITFRLLPRHPITGLEVRGDAGLAPRAVEDFLRQRYGGVPTGARLTAVEDTAAQFLRDEGYLDARVRASTELRHDPEGALLIIEADAGPLARIAAVEVQGTTLVTAPDVIRRTGTSVGQPYRRRSVEAALTGLEEDLRGRGYYEAQATLQTTRSQAGVSLTISVNTGPRVEVRVTPSGVLPGDVDDLIPVRRLGSADQDLLEDARARIESLLRADGYWRASAPFTRTTEATGDRLVIEFTITRGPRYYVDRVDLPTGTSVAPATLRVLIGVEAGEVFDEGQFIRGLAAVVDEYRRAGYYRVQAETAYEEVAGPAAADRASIALQPRITEGPRGLVTAVRFEAAEGPTVPAAELRAVMRSQPGSPYIEADAARDRTAVQTLYLDRGFRTAQVILRPEFANDGRDVVLALQIEEGRQVRIGEISVVGNESISESAIRDELQLTSGEPAGLARITEAQARLIAMGVFRRVSISSVDGFSEPDTHLIVSVVESPDTTVGFGGGLEGGRFNDRLEVAPRGHFEISRRNVGGRNRILSFFSRASLRRSDGSLPGEEEGDGFGFAEYRLAGTFRERRAFRTDTDLLLGVSAEQAVRTTFNFLRRSINAELLRAFGPRVSISGRYQLDFTRLFDERFGDADQLLIDRAFPQVRLSMFSTGVAWDRRDNLLSPTRGTYVSGDFQVAARAAGSEVGFVKTFLQASAFKSLNTSRRTVLAARAEMGLARGFARTASVIDERGETIEIVVEDLPASQRFFAGGSTTVRGFQIDRLAAPELLNEDGLPLGGNALAVFNAELRRSISSLFGRSLGAVVFADAGNVFARAADLNLGKLRGAAGFGVRYDSPLGPLRLDIGFKVRPQTINERRERGWEYHLSIGEAF